MEVKSKEGKQKTRNFFECGEMRQPSETGSERNVRAVLNIGAATLGFLFGGCHLLFGAYPLGLGFVCALPMSVWPALLGAALGSLTLGKSGIIYGMICVLSVFLRVIISGGVKGEGKLLFKESAALRASSAVIGGFVGALYEMLLEGISIRSVLFGVIMVALSGASCLIFSGVFYHGIGLPELCFGTAAVFSSKERGQALRLTFFKISLLFYLFFVSVSLNKYRVFGIDLSFVFASCAALFASKRFGALYGAVAGFTASVGISGTFSVAFALLGAAAGALFVFGSWYATAAGGALLSLWGAYSGGVSGFLSVFPEFLISLCIMTPLFKYLSREKSEEGEGERDTRLRCATDMVGTMALSYRSKKALSVERLEATIAELLPDIKSFCENDMISESYSAVLRLLTEEKLYLLSDREMDESLTDELEEIFEEIGFSDGVIRAFGNRRKYIICAGEDKDGLKITSPALIRGIEEATHLKFTSPEYFRRGDMVLMECESTKKHSIEGAYAQSEQRGEEVNGDTVSVFESKELFAYGLISDGMGSGNEAKRTSSFVERFMKIAAELSSAASPPLHMLNSIVRRKKEECGATLDLFSYDLISGEASFIKCGAAPSFIKRGGSLFRIKSETMPLGFIGQVDAERTSVKICEGDYIIMVSDGICQVGEDAPWLIDFLNKEQKQSPEAFADAILRSAKENGKCSDDLTVLVMKVTA